LRQHGIGREQASEDDDVGQQEQPEPIADDHALGCGSAAAVTARHVRCAMAEAIGILDGDGGICGAHCHSTSPVVRMRWRAARLARSCCATSSAGIMYSGTSRHANTTKVA